mgnify:CR=1 FL=1
MSIILKIFLGLLLILVGIVLFFLIRFQIWKIQENKRGWRVRALGRDRISYQERINNEWEKIEIEGELLIGKISKVIYFKTEKEWTSYPEWAQNRTEIIERIKIEHPPNITEYENA